MTHPEHPVVASATTAAGDFEAPDAGATVQAVLSRKPTAGEAVEKTIERIGRIDPVIDLGRVAEPRNFPVCAQTAGRMAGKEYSSSLDIANRAAPYLANNHRRRNIISRSLPGMNERIS